MHKISPFLWFNDNAEEAVNHYVSVFKNSRIIDSMRCGDYGPGPKGSLLGATFELEGQRFMAINGGPMFQFSPAISLFVSCEDQAEVDELWARLTEGGEEEMCGWLKDKFGISWQIIPKKLMDLLSDPDPAMAGAATQAMLKMRKIVISDLEEAVTV